MLFIRSSLLPLSNVSLGKSLPSYNHYKLVTSTLLVGLGDTPLILHHVLSPNMEVLPNMV